MTIKALLKEFNTCNTKVAEERYRMCKILSTIKESQLYVDFGYDAWSHFVDEEVKCSRGTVASMIRFYNLLYWHSYSKKDAVKLLETVSMYKCIEALKSAGRGASIDLIVARSKAQTTYSMPMTLTSDDKKLIDDTLKMFGCEVTEAGYTKNRGEALLEICKVAKRAGKSRRVKVAA